MLTNPHFVQWAGPGRIALMPRPAGGDWLSDDLVALRSSGVDTLVSALTVGEARELNLLSEEQLAVAAGLAFLSFPIEDLGVPGRGELRVFAGSLAGEVSSGRTVVVHCRAGIGRSGLIVAATLISLGISADQAIEVVSAARGLRSPETDAQRALLAELGTQQA